MQEATPLQTQVIVADQAPAAVWNLLFAGWRAVDRQAEIRRLSTHVCLPAAPQHFVAFTAGEPQAVAALVMTVLPNRTGIIGVPRVADGRPTDCAHSVLAAAMQQLRAQNVAVAQTLIDGPGSLETALFAQAGFEHLAELLYLTCPEESFPGAGQSSSLRYVSFATLGDGGWERLAKVVERSYVGTLDCPRLNGLRPTAEVIEGYRYSGDYLPEAWLIACDGADDVGCLIVTRHGDSGVWELAYMGLAPEVRGRGHGKALVEQAQRLARQGGGKQLIVAVDAQNQPAVSLYRRNGFVDFDCKSAWFHVVRA